MEIALISIAVCQSNINPAWLMLDSEENVELADVSPRSIISGARLRETPM